MSTDPVSVRPAYPLRVQLRSLLSTRAYPDPYAIYRELREHQPVCHVAPLDLFLISRHDDALGLCRNRTLPTLDTTWFAEKWPSNPRNERLLRTMGWSPFYRNPPDHAAARSALGRYFTSVRVRTLRAFIAQQVDHMLDELAGHGSGGHAVDFQQLVARQIPMAVMTRIIGLPTADVPLLLSLVHDLALLFEPILKPSQRQQLLGSHERLLDYLLAFVADRRNHLDGTLTASLLGGRADPMPDHDAAATLAGLLLSGFETTAALLGNGVHALATHPEQARLLASDQGLAGNAVDEVLRWDPPVQVIARRAAEPIHVRQVPVHAGATIVLLCGSANRDPAYCPEPDRFDITRTAGTALSFGSGPHRCLGAHLARVEAVEVFSRLARRFPGLRLAGIPHHRDPGLSVRTFDTLPISVG
jgi:cytochrome P450